MSHVELILKKQIPEPEFYLVWREGSEPRYKHATYESAEKECLRLTNLHGGTFHVLAHRATAVPHKVTLTEVVKDQIPF